MNGGDTLKNKNKTKKQFNKKNLPLKIVAIIALIALLLAMSFNLYVSDYYKTTSEGKGYFVSDTLVDVFTKDDKIFFIPQKPSDTAIIFYPGAKVEATAYAPLMNKLAQRGIYCIICDMPYNLALFDIDAAEDVINMEEFTNINHWYLAGHSLGGSMAASYLSDNSAKYDGIVLLASYSTKSLVNRGITALNIYGSEDGILNMEKLEKYSTNLPENTVTKVIEGGNHASFGCYGEQKGDNKATISNIEQIEQTVQIIVDYIVENQQ